MSRPDRRLLRPARADPPAFAGQESRARMRASPASRALRVDDERHRDRACCRYLWMCLRLAAALDSVTGGQAAGFRYPWGVEGRPPAAGTRGGHVAEAAGMVAGTEGGVPAAGRVPPCRAGAPVRLAGARAPSRAAAL